MRGRSFIYAFAWKRIDITSCRVYMKGLRFDCYAADLFERHLLPIYRPDRQGD